MFRFARILAISGLCGFLWLPLYNLVEAPTVIKFPVLMPSQSPVDVEPTPVQKMDRPSSSASPISYLPPQPTRVSSVEQTTNPLAPETLNARARAALVHIVCFGGIHTTVSGSGVVIDPRGIVLTNAHVAQFVLLASDPRVNLDCTVRSDPSTAQQWDASVLYFPERWVSEHASDIATRKRTSTGEHDYALLFLTNAAPLPFLPIDTRETNVHSGQDVLLAAYPSEFAGSSNARVGLSPVTVFTQTGQRYTFGGSLVDRVDVGNVPLAQSGASGGAVISMEGALVGLISTTSDGATTADRTLSAITLAYINRELAQTPFSALSKIDAEGELERFKPSARAYTDTFLQAFTR